MSQWRVTVAESNDGNVYAGAFVNGLTVDNRVSDDDDTWFHESVAYFSVDLLALLFGDLVG